jgi:superfamily II DNA helicase RecQ
MGVMEDKSKELLGRYEQSVAQIFLQCMSELPFDLGAHRLSDVLRGSQSKFINNNQLNQNSMYGVLSPYPKKRLLELINCLKDHRLISTREHEVYGTSEVLSISRSGRKFLEGDFLVDLEITRNRKTPYQERIEQLRQKHLRAYEPWTEEEDYKLMLMIEENVTTKEIAQVLQRQPSAISSRIRKLDERKAQ